jgi:hypothetical protein
MKNFLKKISTATLVLASLSLSAQDIRGSQGYDFNGTLITKDKADPLEGVSGSPYFNDQAEQGLFIKEGGEKYSAYFKYNIFYDRMEFSESPTFSSSKMLPKTEDILIQMGTDLFKYLEVPTESNVLRGYFEILAMDGDRPAIIKKHEKFIMQIDRSRSNSYGTSKQGDKLRDRAETYYLNNGLAVEIENHKRRSLDAFPEKFEDQLKSFIKENRIKFDDDYRGLQEVVKEYYRISA